ncbi:MAG: hypothetical protein RLZZ196_189 [Bacteroidota bacterium]|jgi:glycosyl transferase family 25
MTEHLQYRYEAANGVSYACSQNGLKSCNIVYINLNDRVDRLQQFNQELKNNNIDWAVRLEGVRHKSGHLGCSLSHLKLLTEHDNYDIYQRPLLMVCEDDCEFLIDTESLNILINEFIKDSKLDVLCLAYNVEDKSKAYEINDFFAVATNIHTTACYILKPHMITPMINSTLKSVNSLSNREHPQTSAIDVVWTELQEEYIFAIANNRAARQRHSFSDVENKVVNYGI